MSVEISEEIKGERPHMQIMIKGEVFDAIIEEVKQTKESGQKVAGEYIALTTVVQVVEDDEGHIGLAVVKQSVNPVRPATKDEVDKKDVGII